MVKVFSLPSGLNYKGCAFWQDPNTAPNNTYTNSNTTMLVLRFQFRYYYDKFDKH